MKKQTKIEDWIMYAESDLAIAKQGKTEKKVLYESLCFHCQQAAEKAIKSVLVFYKIDFPKTHDIVYLLNLLLTQNISVPKVIMESAFLTDYAVTVRYPGDDNMIQSTEYKKALRVSTKVLEWARIETSNKTDKLF